MQTTDKWTCYDCDWDNDVSLLVCEMCDTDRDQSCVERASRDNEALVTARLKQLGQLQEQHEQRLQAEEASRLEEQREAARVLQAEQDEEDRRRSEAESWAAARLPQLEKELRRLRSSASSIRRTRLRALQLELHPDKHPEERRARAQELFLLVQHDWEAVQRAEGDAQEEHQRAAQEERRKAEEDAQRRRSDEENLRRRAAQQNAQPPSQTSQGYRGEQNARADCNQGRSGTRATEMPGGAEDIDSGEESEEQIPEVFKKSWSLDDESEDDTGIVSLLSTGDFSDVMQAFTSIKIARRSRGVAAEKEAHPWRKKMDRLEAEAWRQYAEVQADAGFFHFAMYEHLIMALRLDPDRGELFEKRALYRAKLCCPQLLGAAGVLEADAKEAQKVLEDCKEALSRDSNLLGAYDLAIKVLCLRAELTEASNLASRGRLAAIRAGEKAQAERFCALRRSLRAVSRGLERAEQALAKKHHEAVPGIVSSIRAAALLEFSGILSKRLEGLLKQAETQRHFHEAYAAAQSQAGKEDWAAAWGF